MRAARRQHRATPTSRQAVNGRRIADALALLYAPDTLPEEQRAALLHTLEQAPYRKAQGDLPLAFPEPDA